MEKIKLFIIRWLGIEKEIQRLNSKINSLNDQVKKAEGFIRDRTDISLDPSVHKNGFNYVFVSGRYKGNDYVRLFQVPGVEISHLIERLKHIEKEEYGKLRTVDHSFNGVSEVIKREMK